jgi:hypothetical protein
LTWLLTLTLKFNHTFEERGVSGGLARELPKELAGNPPGTPRRTHLGFDFEGFDLEEATKKR